VHQKSVKWIPKVHSDKVTGFLTILCDKIRDLMENNWLLVAVRSEQQKNYSFHSTCAVHSPARARAHTHTHTHTRTNLTSLLYLWSHNISRTKHKISRTSEWHANVCCTMLNMATKK